jgi:pimeloyl-ACP methyl ester carboxylesterase
LLAPDRPGHGRSPDARQDFDAEAPLIADQLLDEPVHLVGHSYGAIVAMLAAARRADHVESLVLIEPPATGVAAGNPIVDSWGAELRALFSQTDEELPTLLGRFFASRACRCPCRTLCLSRWSVARVRSSVPAPRPKPNCPWPHLPGQASDVSSSLAGTMRRTK